MKNPLYFASSLLCLSLCSAWADAPQQDDLTDTPPVGYQPEAVTTEPRGLITPTVSPRVDHGQEIMVDIDFIWWKSYVSNYDYAQIGGKILSPQFQFEPGFKIGTGMDLYHDGWDLYAEYTWLHQGELRSSGSSITPGYSTLVVPFAQGADIGVLSSISLFDTSAWRKYRFNILDGEVGRDFFISKRLTLRPHVGVKAVSLFEKTKIIYVGDGPVDTSTVTLKQNLSGIGIRGGLDTFWRIIPCFGFYGDFAFTALWGSFHDSMSNKIIFNRSRQTYSLHRKSQDILPVFEVGLGLAYEVWFKKERYQLFTKAGWEEQIWVGYNKNIINGQTTGNGALTLQGLTWKVGFVF